MEINRRMSKRFACLLGIGILVVIGFLLACGTTYNSSSDGLLLVSSQGSGLMESFSFSLANGHISSVSNPPSDTSNLTCVLKGLPASVVIDPKGAFAYAIVLGDVPLCGSSSATGIQAFKVNSNGTIAATGNLISDPSPVALAMDSSGKFLFVAEGVNSFPSTTNPPSTTPCPGTTAQYGVCVYAIGSGAALTPVPGNFNFVQPNSQTPNFVALAPTPTTLPGIGINGVQNAICSDPGNNPPTSEYLYVADSVNNVVWEFGVNTSTGVLTNPPGRSQVWPFPAGTSGAVTSGVVVDPCDRFVYASNMQSNQIVGWTLCSVVTSTCPNADGTLNPVPNSPFSLTGGANGPGPLLVDPFGNYLYVLDTLSNQVSPFHISSVSGSLTPGSVVVTGLQPTSIAIRADDSWLFVANFNAATLSEYSVTPATGVLSATPAVQTDNYPFGLAVK
jgi:6-phosphogluconolactonase (cycloisomerase 2 family)